MYKSFFYILRWTEKPAPNITVAKILGKNVPRFFHTNSIDYHDIRKYSLIFSL